MSRLHGTVARLRLLLARRATESRMNEEFRFHIEMETEKNMRAGMSYGEARRRAAIAFGGVEHHKEAMRDDRSSTSTSTLTFRYTRGSASSRSSTSIRACEAMTSG